ncbi:hypothetical protein [Flavobacterium sp. N1994]|uniref:hypothetical protein n=1 Tax=Flavobacterium sp. N1994 TaxID=2986827 RepID=UPI002221E15C|nr:hypothetical protein [Flavobacterium sp. N1994]
MQAYNREVLENGLLVMEAKRLFKMKFISKEQLTNVTTAFSLLKSSSIFIRFGFFLLGLFLFSSIGGFLALVFGQLLNAHYSIMFYLYAIIGFSGSELLAKSGYYRHGLDDAFIICAQATFCGAIGMSSESSIFVFSVMFFIGLASCIRYVNTISALISCVGLVGFFFTLITELKVISSMYLPFIGLILAVTIYYVFYKLNNSAKWLIYQNPLQIIKIVSLVLAYASINYMVVRELSESLMGIVVDKEHDIPLAFLFYGLTFLIPLGYVYYSLQRKDRTILIVGLLSLSYSFFTIRFYYSLMPLESALVLAGLLLFAISFFAIKKLQNKTTGINFQPDRDTNSTLILNAQALIINSQISTKPIINDSKMPFGGGGFSGGGSGESF